MFAEHKLNTKDQEMEVVARILRRKGDLSYFNREWFSGKLTITLPSGQIMSVNSVLDLTKHASQATMEEQLRSPVKEDKGKIQNYV